MSRSRRFRLAGGALLAGLAAWPPGAPAGPAAGKVPPLAFGVTTGIPDGRLGRLVQIEHETGAHVSLVNWFQPFGTALLAQRARAVLASGRTPVVSWQPVDRASSDPSELGRILAGDDDAYLASFALAAAALPGVVWIRFAPELNGRWEPWGAGVNGNSAADLVAAWRHLHAVFAGLGVTNVRWFWCPNVPGQGEVPLRDLYPGDDQVDVVGLDGYNFGRARPGQRWRSFAEIFGAGLRTLLGLSGRPIVLGEVATVHDHGREAAWIRDFLRVLDGSPAVRGFVWFDVSKRLNTRIDATSQSVAAFRGGFRALRRGVARGSLSVP